MGKKGKNKCTESGGQWTKHENLKEKNTGKRILRVLPYLPSAGPGN